MKRPWHRTRPRDTTMRYTTIQRYTSMRYTTIQRLTSMRYTTMRYTSIYNLAYQATYPTLQTCSFKRTIDAYAIDAYAIDTRRRRPGAYITQMMIS